MRAPTPDVLVIGGGPAGTVTATRLAGMGVEVMLVDSAAAFRAPYDVVISESTISSLSLELPARPVTSLRLRFDDRDSRVVPVPELYSCDQAIFRERLIQAAIAAGVTVIGGTATQDAEARLMVKDCDGAVVMPNAAHLVLATGSSGLGSVTSQAVGFTYSRVIYGSEPSPETTLYFATPPTTTSAWVLRGPGDSCTLTITASNGERSGEQLFADTVAELATVEPYFAGIRGTCPGIGSFTNLGFSPQTCLDQGRILVGDAAGLTNPFTGEGISYAVQSGEIAASCIAAALDDPEGAAAQYQQEMARTFVGYFETSQHADHRYRLAWRTMAATLTDDSPFFAKARRAMILPEGPRKAGSRQLVARSDSALVEAFTAACDSLEVAAVRTEWPFLARLMASNEGPLAHQLRPAVPFLAAVVAGGSPPPAAAAPVAAGIELATLAVLASVGSPQAQDQGIDWPRAATVMAGDFLLSVAGDLVASVGEPSLSGAFADWVRELTALRAGRLQPEGLLPTPAAELFGALFEFPCRAGAELAGLPPSQARQLRDHGYHSGQAFLFAEDLRALHGRPTRLDTTLDNLLRSEVSSLPDLLPGVTAEAELDRDLADRLLREALANQVARTTLSGLPDRSTRILTAFTQALAEA
ncbi:FAD-dependent monooxygenase [Kribbella catacumbae]|uniref:FAD-dependent monooxygenase n=1 Tax=Kribbella catacumbae TaxID=460086 RepID=UPI0003A4E1D8|nr:FAD-dependent monooxygenase [Kribbella catacumbae]